MTDMIERQQAISAVAERLHEIAPPSVVQVYAGFQSPSGAELHGAIIGAVEQDGQWGFGQFDQDPVVYDLVQAFYDACEDEPWSTCEVHVGASGEFEVSLGYDPLPEGEDLDPAMLARLQDYQSSFVERFGAAPEPAAPARRGLFGRRRR